MILLGSRDVVPGFMCFEVRERETESVVLDDEVH